MPLGLTPNILLSFFILNPGPWQSQLKVPRPRPESLKRCSPGDDMKPNCFATLIDLVFGIFHIQSSQHKTNRLRQPQDFLFIYLIIWFYFQTQISFQHCKPNSPTLNLKPQHPELTSDITMAPWRWSRWSTPWTSPPKNQVEKKTWKLQLPINDMYKDMKITKSLEQSTN